MNKSIIISEPCPSLAFMSLVFLGRASPGPSSEVNNEEVHHVAVFFHFISFVQEEVKNAMQKQVWKLRGPPLDPLHVGHVPPEVRCPKLDAVLQLQSHQCRTEWEYHLPGPVCDAPANAQKVWLALLTTSSL